MSLWVPLKYRKRRNVNVLIPSSFIGGKGTIYDAFLIYANQYGDEKPDAIQLVKLLPEPIKGAPVWYDRITDLWRYTYGSPYDRLPEDTLISGTNVHLPVNELYKAVKIADRRLSKEQLIHFLERLSDRDKHTDVIFEMRPLANVSDNIRAYYEVSGRGPRNTTVDWQVKGRFMNIVFDVKNRVKSFINHISNIIPQLSRGEDYTLPPPPDPADLFMNVENKLKEESYLCQLQGVWIHSEIKEDESKLNYYFNNKLNKKKVHFAVLSDWQDDAFILSRNRFITKVIIKLFRLTQSTRFVSRDYPS